VRPDRSASQLGPPQADWGPTSERVGGESGVDDAGPPASDVIVDGTRADELGEQSSAAQTA
jgi:hypothetical protein